MEEWRGNVKKLLSGILFFVFVVAIGWGLSYYYGSPVILYVAIGLSVVMNIASYWFSDKIVLRMYRARPVSETEAPTLHRMVRELAQQAGLPMPKLCVMPSQSPNAFATGRNPQHAVVAVTEGILEVLHQPEIKGVLAHEMAHVRRCDAYGRSLDDLSPDLCSGGPRI